MPLSTHYLDDEQVEELSVLAELVYLRGLLHAKRAASDGVVSVRRIAGGLIGKPLAPGDPEVDLQQVQAAAQELATVTVRPDDRPLWEPLEGAPGRYRISAYLKHNEAAEAVENRRRSDTNGRRIGALKTNHGKGLHENNPVPDCPLCEENPQVGAVEGASAPPTAADSGRSERAPSGAPDAPHLRRTSPQQPPLALDLVTAVADRLGTTTEQLLRRGITGAVARAKANSWTDHAITGTAAVAATKTAPLAWLAKTLEAAEPPDAEYTTAEEFTALFERLDAAADGAVA
ncbi:MAG: hypothetical protein AAGA65_23930 [Actinomycetota bacterium]